jgi:hypothetical protein
MNRQELSRIFPHDGRVDRAVMDLALYVPRVPTRPDERIHWDKNIQLFPKELSPNICSPGNTLRVSLCAIVDPHHRTFTGGRRHGPRCTDRSAPISEGYKPVTAPSRKDAGDADGLWPQ